MSTPRRLAHDHRDQGSQGEKGDRNGAVEPNLVHARRRHLPRRLSTERPSKDCRDGEHDEEQEAEDEHGRC